MREYFLSSKAFMCEVGGYVVFLDLSKDRYLAVAPESVRELSMFLPALRAVQREAVLDGRDSRDSGPQELAKDLEKEGLLVGDATVGKPFVPLEVQTPASSLRIGDWERHHADPKCLLSLQLARASAKVMLSLFPLKTIAERVELRKRRRSALSSETNSDIERLRKVCSGLRPKHFSIDDACLRNSLVMIEFLAQYDIFVDWIFGVRINPFAAHCWVQCGSVVVNDSVHNVEAFTPIMRI